MADVEVHAAEPAHGRIQTLRVRFKNAPERTIDRDTALAWLAEGHALLTYAGSAHHPHKGQAIHRVEVDGSVYLRTDTRAVAEDALSFPHEGGH
jgi:hypothetical protein